MENKLVLEQFNQLIFSEQKRINKMKKTMKPVDFTKLKKIIIGIVPGDGIGPIIMNEARIILKQLLKDEVRCGKIEFREISGMTIEERSASGQSVPDDVLKEIKECNVILKGPSTTPRPGDPWPNMPSANAILRRELDLYANVRPVKIKEKNIDWTFFRENIEGCYLWGNDGVQINEDLAVDFVVETRPGSGRIARLAFDYAQKNSKKNVTAVTKSNIVKRTDGNFVKSCREVAQTYPEIDFQEKLIDVMAAKLNDLNFSQEMSVFVLPNLYGDIMTDIAAEIQGGIGTAGSANIGDHYAVFEAIHGSAPYLIENNRGNYADPSSLFRAVSLLLSHIGYMEKSEKLNKALELCELEKKYQVTSFKEGSTTQEYGNYVQEKLLMLMNEVC